MGSLQVAVAAIALSGVGQTALLDFYSDSCGPCRQMNPTVQSLIDAGYPVQRVNVSQNARLAVKYGVQRVPCFVMVANGKEVGRILGKTSYANLEQLCKAGAAASRASPPSAAPPLLAMSGPSPAAAATLPAPMTLQPAMPMPICSPSWRSSQSS